MENEEYRPVRSPKKKKPFLKRLARHTPTITVLTLFALLLCGIIFLISHFLHRTGTENTLLPETTFIQEATPSEATASEATASEITRQNAPEDLTSESEATPAPEPLPEPDEIDLLIAQADRIAAGYDYEAAKALLADTQDDRVTSALARYDEAQSSLVPADTAHVTHVFFHSLIVDTDKAFDGDSMASSYNSVMTTVDEFTKILDELYNRGYVLVRIHDIASLEWNEYGTQSFVWGNILLPEGKTPIVMSQDDLCYYEYMEGDGFASRIIIGEDGKPTCEMTLEDGSTVTGSYDLVPILEDFIQEHPDFSYKGARAILAFTGYQGILGYRTAFSYSENPTYEQDRTTAAEVAQCLRDNGWELASHSYGHLELGISDTSETGYAISWDRFKTDVDRWEEEVESLIGPTDIMIFPFGNDIARWHEYTSDIDRFIYLQMMGFNYFCNVDASTISWCQMGTSYFRMARRNLDGYRLYEDIIQEDPEKKRLTDLFEAADIFDPARPLPVEWSY